MTEEVRQYDHDEVELLLPWHVNNTLGPGDSAGVAEHLTECTVCQESVALLLEVQSAVVRNKASPIVPRPKVGAFLDSIEANISVQQRAPQLSRIFIAAAVTILTLISTLMLTNQDDIIGVPGTFETATSSQSVASMDYVLRIQFEPATSAVDHQRVLQDMQARDITWESEEGTFRVIVQLRAASLEDLDRYTSALAALAEVSTVTVVALQLPMTSHQ